VIGRIAITIGSLTPARDRADPGLGFRKAVGAAADTVVNVRRPVDRHGDRVDSELHELPGERLEPAAVGDDGAGQAATLDLRDERHDVRIQERLSAEEADDRVERSDLVEETHVIGQGELPLRADELHDPLALEGAVARVGAGLGAEDAGVAPLTAHLAAQVAEVRDAQLHERRHRQVVGRRRGQVFPDGAAARRHAAEMAPREPRKRQPAAKAHGSTLLR
jgi:hypothetical protein